MDWHDIADVLRRVDGRWLGCELRYTHGNAKWGMTKYFLVMPRWSRHEIPTHKFKAYDTGDAIDHLITSRAAYKMLALRWVEEFNKMIADG